MDVRKWNFQRGYVEVNLDYILHNLEKIHEKTDVCTKILAVVKTDAYGHGSVAVAKTVEKLDYLFGYAVATAEEAFELREAGIEKPILVLGYSFPYAYSDFVDQEIRISVFREDMLEELSEIAVQKKKNAIVHIKVDTGMGRIGINPNVDGIQFVKKAMQMPGIQVEGIFTHFACADRKDLSSAEKQLEVFSKFTERAEQEIGCKIPLHHCSNSAGILQMKQANMDLARAGIIMYGLQPSDEVDMEQISLKPALSLRSHIIYIKEMQQGQSISYGSTYTVKETMKVATVPLGYGDGYPRSLSGKSYVLIRGQKAPILGRICMDQFMVDVTGIAKVREGDPVTLIGCDETECITADRLGEVSGRFNYELVCNLNHRLPRVYILNGELL